MFSHQARSTIVQIFKQITLWWLWKFGSLKVLFYTKLISKDYWVLIFITWISAVHRVKVSFLRFSLISLLCFIFKSPEIQGKYILKLLPLSVVFFVSHSFRVLILVYIFLLFSLNLLATYKDLKVLHCITLFCYVFCRYFANYWKPDCQGCLFILLLCIFFYPRFYFLLIAFLKELVVANILHRYLFIKYMVFEGSCHCIILIK